MLARMIGLCVAVAFVGGMLLTAQAGETATVVKGTVVMACPMGKILKLKPADAEEMTFSVAPKAQEQVKALKAGESVEVSYIKCPKTGKLILTAVKKS
jgi:hypothetical protein